MDATGVRRVRLYDARHAILSWMANNGVPDTVVPGVGRALGPVVHEARLRPPRPAVPEGRFGEAGRTARLTLIHNVCEKL